MKFDIYGRFRVEVRREAGAWAVYRSGNGMRVALEEFVIPSDVAELDLATWLDDVFHEYAGPGQTLDRLPDA